MVYELERVLRVCNGFICSMSVTYDGAYNSSISLNVCRFIHGGIIQKLPDQISGIFRAMMPVFDNHDTSVITPLLASGNQVRCQRPLHRVFVIAYAVTILEICQGVYFLCKFEL